MEEHISAVVAGQLDGITKKFAEKIDFIEDKIDDLTIGLRLLAVGHSIAKNLDKKLGKSLM